MKKLLFTALASALLSAGHAQGKEVSPAPAKPLKAAEYTIYSGELGNEQAPTKNDRKLAIEISGPAAKEIFDSLYPDSKVTCSSEKGERLRRKRDLWCAYQPSDGYRCFLGVNLRTGESIPGGSC
ncbi:hypothetical protein ACFOLJ_17460 [Rugamonas sp. CCM 8940]|uniref:hypothetical protein n=1 Tax=Rugamonas sp. CCM 8940 TaxID=2765359 RepID=UPI0018F47537|nr:hypothetical protein [Rugamonas sp. CCM 8940]MBJ7309995.1 hypothetical protein [Rugamonas sp. CCM 8940]